MSGPPPVTTLVPFAQLPACATSCGPLYDVNGHCVSPANTATASSDWVNCFCGDSRLTPLSSTAANVCANTLCDSAGLSGIQSWYTGFCAGQAAVAAPTGTGTSSSASGSNTAGSSSDLSTNDGGGGSWLSGHYQWVIFLVVMVVAIAGIWIGACVWRRRYLQRKDRAYALGKNLAHATASGRVVPNASNAGSLHVPGAGFFNSAPLSAAGVYDDHEKPMRSKSKRWVVKDRT